MINDHCRNGTSISKHIAILSRLFLYIPLIYVRLLTAQFFIQAVRLRRHYSALADDFQPLAEATLMHLCFPI